MSEIKFRGKGNKNDYILEQKSSREKKKVRI